MKFNKLILLGFIVLSASTAYGNSGVVVHVLDGDTLTLLTDKKTEVRVRLKEIDAPESSQAFGYKAKQALLVMCAGKKAELRDVSVGKYGRTLANVYCDGVYVNKELVKKGMAWVYRRYSKDPSMIPAEEKAKSAKLGLWSGSNPIPPWEFRRR